MMAVGRISGKLHGWSPGYCYRNFLCQTALFKVVAKAVWLLPVDLLLPP